MTMMTRRWVPAALIAGAGVASMWARGRLPAWVDVRLEVLLPFALTAQADPAPRWLVLWLMPTLALLLYALFRLAPRVAARRVGRRLFRHAPAEVTSAAQVERFGRTYDVIVLGVVLMVVGLHAAMLGAALQEPAAAARIMPAVLGVSLVMMGNVMPRLRPNWVAGLRSRRLLEDPTLWRRTHRVFGAAFVVSGIATICAAAAAPEYGVTVAVVSILASCLIGWLASRRENGPSVRASLRASLLLCAAAGSASAQTTPPEPQVVTPPEAVAESPFTFERDGRTPSRRTHFLRSSRDERRFSPFQPAVNHRRLHIAEHCVFAGEGDFGLIAAPDRYQEWFPTIA
jgi:hypothetical protein